MPQYGQIKLVGAIETFVAEVTHDPLTPGMIRKLANGRPALRPIQVIPDPPFDPETKKLGPFSYTTLPGRVMKARNVVPLSVAEKDTRRLGKIAATDVALLGAIEGLVDALLRKGAIVLTDLPADTRATLSERKALRQSLGT